MIADHEFEDEAGNELSFADLTEITYEVVRTYLDIVIHTLPHHIVFTHIIKIRPESFDHALLLRG